MTWRDIVPHNTDHFQVRLGLVLVTWRDIVPHNTDHFQVRLGLVLFLVTWRDFVPHNTDHFQVRLDLVLFLVTWRDIVPHNTDHFQVRLGLVLVTWRDIVPHNTHFQVRLGLVLFLVTRLSLLFSLTPFPLFSAAFTCVSATASCPWRLTPSSDVHGYNAVAGGCCVPRMTYFARRHIGLLSEAVPKTKRSVT